MADLPGPLTRLVGRPSLLLLLLRLDLRRQDAPLLPAPHKHHTHGVAPSVAARRKLNLPISQISHWVSFQSRTNGARTPQPGVTPREHRPFNTSKPQRGGTNGIDRSHLFDTLRPMPQSLSRVLVHIIFSTKHREPLISDEIRPRLHAYLVGILDNLLKVSAKK